MANYIGGQSVFESNGGANTAKISGGVLTIWESNNTTIQNPDWDPNDKYSLKYTTNVSENATVISANQKGYQVGFKQFAALIIGESDADHPTVGESAALGSTIINRINSLGPPYPLTSLSDPNWINKVGTASAYDGVNTARYKSAMKMSIDEIAAKYPIQFEGILEAYNHWGTDYGGNTNPSYYWTAKGLKSGYAYQQWLLGNMMRNNVGNTTFYAFKVSTWQWTP